jgi:beta-glucosidase-like glycosyl hydrolase
MKPTDPGVPDTHFDIFAVLSMAAPRRNGRARSVMTEYNLVDGSPATQDRGLLNGIFSFFDSRGRVE